MYLMAARDFAILATNEASVSLTCVLKPRLAPPRRPNPRRRGLVCYRELPRTRLPRRWVNKCVEAEHVRP
jgi:hypothetical protein